MQCPSCRTENREGSRFCTGCGVALAPRCGACGTECALGDRFCAICGAALGRAGAPAAARTDATSAERRQVTVLFCDLVGSTAMSRAMDPEDLREVIRAYQDACQPILERFGGFVARYMGDGILVYFGYPQAHEDDAERAVRAALGIVAAVPALSYSLDVPGLAVRVGIATGLVVVGDVIGEGAAEEKAIIGETPNLAARLQGVARSNEVVVDRTTHRLAGRWFRYDALGGLELKGFETPVEAHRVLKEAEDASRFEAIRSPVVAPLVGRDDELALLRGRWGAARLGDGQVVLLSGEAGIGKSRLAEALAAIIAEDPHVRLRYQCSPHHSHSALYPMISQIERSVRFGAEDDPRTRLAKLEALLAPAPERRDEVVPLIAALLSVPTEGVFPDLDLSPQRQKARTLEAVVEMLERQIDRAPLVLLIEDIQWIDPTSRELLDLMVGWARTARALIVATTRPRDPPAWAGEPHVTVVHLGRLEPRHCAELVPGVAGTRALPRELVERIVARTDGVPLFVEELTRSLVESGVLDAGAEDAASAARAPDAAIPSTLQASLLARLDRLGWVKEVAHVGAAIGREFTDDLLAAVAGLPRVQLDEALDVLVDSQLLQRSGSPPEVRYTFKHALVQDAAYESMLRRRRQELHGRIAQALESRPDAASGAHAAALARHFTEAGVAERAVRYWLKAGEWAIARSADVDAIAHLERGIALLDQIADEATRRRCELDLKIALTVPLTAVKGYVAPEVERLVTRAGELCLQLDDRRQRFVSVHALYRYYVVRAEHRTAADYSYELLSLAQESGDAGSLVEAHKSLALSLTYLGEFSQARSHAEQAIALFDPGEHRSHAFVYGTDPGVISYSYLGHALWFLGFPDQALGQAEQAVARGRAVSHPFSEVFAVLNAATLHAFRGDWRELGERAAEGVRLSTEQGFPFWLGWAGALTGYLIARTKSPQEGIPLMQRTLDGFAAAGVGFARPLCLALLGESLQRAGDCERALTVLEQGLEETRAEGYMYRAELFRLRGDALLTRGGAADDAVQESYQRAIEVARAQQARSLELRVAMSLARFQEARGRREDARAVLAAVYDRFTEGFETQDLRDARTLLDTLAR